MKKFIFKIIIPVCLGVVIIFGGFEYILRSLPNDIKYKSTWLNNNASRLKILILGSSNTSMGINPKFLTLSPSFNAAYAAQSLEQDEWIYKRFYSKFDSLKYIILDMNYRELWHENTPEGRSPTYVKKYRIYYDLPYYKGFNNEFEISANIKDIYNNVFNINKQTSFRTVDSLGFQCDYYTDLGFNDTEWKKYASFIADYYNADVVDDAVFNKNISYLHSIATMAQKKGVEVIILTCPVHRFFRESIKLKQYQDILMAMDTLCEKFDNVHYYNFFNSVDFKDDEFYNVDHLNDKGSKHFTQIVDSIIQIVQTNNSNVSCNKKNN